MCLQLINNFHCILPILYVRHYYSDLAEIADTGGAGGIMERDGNGRERYSRCLRMCLMTFQPA
ncbi:hypothetical protein A9975_26815 [Cupriavidus sp. UME77]|nr:hypothetical protein [Cupriavidus sp. UME77]